MKYYYRVKYGFNALDQVSIDETELEKALYAQKFGEVVQLGNKQVNGKYIISIEPHYHKYTGWYESYEPTTGEDFVQIERDCPKGIESHIKNTREKVDYLLSHNQKHLIGKNIVIPELESGQKGETDTSQFSNLLANNFKIK